MPDAGARSAATTRLTINKEFGSFEAFIEEYVTNISRTGAFVKTTDPPPVGTEINLKFTVIVDDIETIEGVGKVVRVQDDPPGMGVVFTQHQPPLAALAAAHAHRPRRREES